MVSWTIFKNHLLGVGPIQNLETMTLWTLTTVDSFYFTICKNPYVWIESIKTTFGWGPGHIWLHTTLEHPWPHYMTSEVCWDDVWTLPFGLSQTSQSRLLAHVWSGPKLVIDSLSPSIQWIEEKVGGGRFILFYHVRARMNRNSSKRHSTEGPGHIWLHTTLEDPWPRYMISEVCWEGVSTLPFGLSQLHGRGSWLVHEVALS